MKDVLERFGPTEFLAYLCPGVIGLLSLVLWLEPNFARVLGAQVSSQQVVVALFLLILSYALGLIIASWASSGANYYIRSARIRKITPHQGPYPVWWQLVSFFHWMREPDFNLRANRSIVEAQVQVSQDLDTYGGLHGQSSLASPWEMLERYRIVMVGRVSDEALPIFAEAQTVHTRLLFALGVALALLVFGMQAAIRLLVLGIAESTGWDPSIPDVSWPLLLTLGGLAIGASFGLRMVASHWWGNELFLTRGITNVRILKERVRGH